MNNEAKKPDNLFVMRLLAVIVSAALCASVLPLQANATIMHTTPNTWVETMESVELRDQPDAEGSLDSARSASLIDEKRDIKNSRLEKSDAPASLSSTIAPTVLSADALSPTQVRIAWSGSSEAKEYGVYRQAYGTSVLSLVGITQETEFVDSSAKPGTIYGYVVFAKFADSEISDMSNAKLIATPPRNTSLTVSAAFPKGANVKWKASEGATHYYVYRAVKGSSKFNLVQSTTSTSFLDTKAQGHKYIYKVRPLFVLEKHVYSQADETAIASCDAGKWKLSGRSKSFIFSDGRMAKNWQLIDGKWYCFSASGKMLKNAFKKTSGKKYFLGSNGVMKTGWVAKDGKKYYMLKGGGAAKGWKTISGKRYHFSKSGALTRNKYIDGYHINGNGYWDGRYRSGSSVGTVKGSKTLLTLVNKARRAAGAGSLKWDSGLASAAKLRAIEIKRLFSHTRPNGTSCFTAFPDYLYAAGENIARGQRSTRSVNIAWTNSPGHYSNMVNKMFDCFGAACFTINGTKYWVELFGSK